VTGDPPPHRRSHAGQRRNRFVSHAHGFLGQNGQSPEAIAAKGLEEVLACPTVAWRDGLVTEARMIPDGFAVRADVEEYQGGPRASVRENVGVLRAVFGFESNLAKAKVSASLRGPRGCCPKDP
jgi:hypothetical protein